MALHDSLTGLPNRNLFEDRLGFGAAHAHRHGGSIALLFIDLDRFKPINDELGHEAGDEALREIARRLPHLLRGTDTAARIGGDEFAVILQPDVDAMTAARIAERIIRTLQQPMKLKGRDCTVGASIGIAIYPADSADAAQLMRLADEAMYRAKQAGGNRFALAARARTGQPATA